MKKLLCVLLTALLLFSACLLSACGLIDAFSNKVPTTYDNAEKYTAGNGEFEGKVDTFFIWWLYGNVTIKTHKENTVKIEESANKELTDDFRLHWRYHNVTDYGNVLYIRYSASGDFDYGDLQKDITVYLPENDDMHLSFTIDAAAVDVDVSTFENTLEKLSISTNSGSVSAKIDSADEVRISGQNEEDVPTENREFFLRASGTVEDLGISTSYAKVDVAVKSVYSGEVGSVFADLIFAADSVKDIKLQNSRNHIHATVLHFDSLDIETRDGACELMLSPDASFVLSIKPEDRFDYEMSPENVTIDFDEVTEGDAQYTVGSGKSKIAIATDNDLFIRPVA